MSEKESNRAKERELEENMITVCAAAHPCVNNRVHWGTLFMLFIWLHTEREAESCLNSIKKCSVVCILYLWEAMQRGNLCYYTVTYSSGIRSLYSGRLSISGECFSPMFKSSKTCLRHLHFLIKCGCQEFNL